MTYDHFTGSRFNLYCSILIVAHSETGSYLLLILYTSCYEAGASLFSLVLICISSFLHRSEFIFINPNSKGQCGCGESFMTTTGSTANQGSN
ncbi:hypothetical protein Gotur_031310 [Gossypium turneri]